MAEKRQIEETPEIKALRALQSIGCICGLPKKAMHSLCWRCYDKLPKNLRSGLFLGIRNGYVAAYQAAIEWLRANTKRLKESA